MTSLRVRHLSSLYQVYVQLTTQNFPIACTIHWSEGMLAPYDISDLGLKSVPVADLRIGYGRLVKLQTK